MHNTADTKPAPETAPNIGAVSGVPAPSAGPPFPPRQAVAPARRTKAATAVRAAGGSPVVHRHSLRGLP